MLEHVNRRKLIYGKKYYMKRTHRTDRSCTDIIFYGYVEIDAFDSDSEFEMDNFAWVKCLNSVVMEKVVSNNIIEIDI
jgi:hypothetical protein